MFSTLFLYLENRFLVPITDLKATLSLFANVQFNSCLLCCHFFMEAIFTDQDEALLLWFLW